MLTLQSLLSLPVWLSTSLIAHALAVPDGFIDLDEKGAGTKLATQLTGGEDCGDKQIQAIREGFTEMNSLFQAALNIDWNGDPEREFFGQQDRIANFTDMIQSNLVRASQYANLAGNTTRNPDIHVRCDDPNDFCDEGNKKDGKHVAYNIGNEPHINFCGRYFGLDPLDKTVNDAAGDASTNTDIMRYYNRGALCCRWRFILRTDKDVATAWARQVMHISTIGTAVIEKVDLSAPSNSTAWVTKMYNVPMNTSFLAGVMNERPQTPGPNDIQTLKYAYGATRSKLLATLSTQEPYDAANNAESYALYAQAKYVMAKKNLYPSSPVIEYDNEITVLMNNQLQEGEKKRFACYDAMDVV